MTNNKYTAIRKIFSQPVKQDNSFNKKLYDSDITQDVLDRLNELEDRIKKLESRCLK
jgi:hypothetical protein